MRLEWPAYVFTACVFLAFALGVQFLDLGTGAVVGLFFLLTVAYAWVAYVMIKQKDVRELIGQWNRSRRMMKGMGGNRKLNKQIRKMMKEGDMDPSSLGM